MIKNKRSGGAAERRKQIASGQRCVKKYGPALTVLEQSTAIVKKDLAFNCLGAELARCRFIDMDVDSDGQHLMTACELTLIGTSMQRRLEAVWANRAINAGFTLDKVDLEVNLDTGEIKAYVRLEGDLTHTLPLGLCTLIWEPISHAL